MTTVKFENLKTLVSEPYQPGFWGCVGHPGRNLLHVMDAD